MENLKIRTEDIDDVATFTRFGFADLLRQISQHPWLIWAITVIALCTVGSALTAVFLPGARAVLLGEDGIINRRRRMPGKRCAFGRFSCYRIWAACGFIARRPAWPRRVDG